MEPTVASAHAAGPDAPVRAGAPSREPVLEPSSGDARWVVRLPNWIGDAVMAAPSVLRLIEAAGDGRVDLIGIAPVRGLFEGVRDPRLVLPGPLPAKVSRPDRFLRAARTLRARRYAAGLVLPPSFSSALLFRAARIPVRVGWPTDGRARVLTHSGETPDRTSHLRDQYERLVDRFLEVLGGGASPIYAPEPGPRPRLPLLPEEIAWGAMWWEQRGLDPARTLALAPGAIYGATKRWPPEHFLALGRELAGAGWNLLWIGGPAERDLARDLAERARTAGSGDPVSLSVAGGLSLRQSLAVLARLRAVVSNDSGAMHLAQAAGAPVIGIFGSTSPTWTGPVGSAARVVTLALACAPCFSRTCPTRIECLGELTPARVRTSLDELLGATERRGRPAVFLDRDGTLIEPVHHLTDPAEVRLVPGGAKAIGRLRAAGYRVVVVTNQSAVARGLLDERRLLAVHRELARQLARAGQAVDGLEWCPHHPEHSGPCACRKPAPGLLARAAHRLDLDLERSWMIGDAEADAGAAAAAGVRFALVRTGYGAETERRLGSSPSLTADDVASAVDGILSERPSQ